MLKLADTYENELYLDHGAVSDESDIRISAADIINRLSEYCFRMTLTDMMIQIILHQQAI